MNIHIILFLAPNVFLTTTWYSDSQRSLQIPSLSVQPYCVHLICFTKTRCPFSLFSLYSSHSDSYLELLEAKLLFSEEHLATLMHESH